MVIIIIRPMFIIQRQKKDKRIFHALSTKDLIEAKTKQIELANV